MEELKKLLEAQGKAFDAFKAANDAEIAALKKGQNDPLLKGQVDKANEEVGKLQKQIDELAKKASRTGAGDEDPRASEKAAHGKAFDAYVRKGTEGDLLDLQQKAVQISSDPAGGFAVTETIDTKVAEYERDNAPMRQEATVITVSNEKFEKLISQNGTGTGWVDENESRSESNAPQLAAVAPAFGEIYSMPGATQKSLDDMFFNVEEWLAREIGTEFALAENVAFTTGTGVKKPKGMLAGTLSTNADASLAFGEIQKVKSGTNGAFVADKVLDLIHALKRGYRQNAKLMANALSVAALRKLKDGQNNYLWQGSFVGGQPSTLLGYDIVENDAMADPAIGSISLAFGDYKRAYLIVDVRGIRVLRDPFTAKPKVLFYTTKRVGGVLVDNRAIKVQTLET